MGAFILFDQQKHAEKRSALDEAMKRACLPEPLEISAGCWTLLLNGKISGAEPQIVQFDNGDFCAATGTLFYRGLFGRDALEEIYQQNDPNDLKADDFDGNFTVILKKDSKLYLFTDPLGTYRCFHDQNNSLWSSSFLAVCAATPQKTINTQAIYEYIFQGSTYGKDTPFVEISMLDRSNHVTFSLERTGVEHTQKSDILSRQIYQAGQHTIHELQDQTIEILGQQSQAYQKAFGNNIDTALSGGYDSRLMLAMLRKVGVSPHIHVYGHDTDPDVVVAKTICQGEGLELNHTNKSTHKLVPAEQYGDVIQKQFNVMDGFPNEGIFDSGANLQTRLDRAGDNNLALNGGGGEIFRDFFHLSDRPVKLKNIIDVFYSQYDPNSCTEAFDEKAYRQRMMAKIAAALNTEDTTLDRKAVETIYALFRLRYWMGKNNTINNRFGFAVTPFTQSGLLRLARDIPLAEKYDGLFQANVIQQMDAKLASYLSDYGYNFSDPVPAKNKLKNRLNLYRPFLLRRHAFALKNRKRKISLPACFQHEYISRAIDPACPIMSRYIDLHKVNSLEQLNRIYTLEYLFSR